MSFDSRAIEAWAQLSGDRNPIHFDQEAAARMGVADRVVHGMLVLLRIKEAVRAPAATDDGGWVQFRALLKAPVVVNAPVELKVQERTDRLTFRLTPSQGTLEHVLGNVRRVGRPQWTSSALRHRLPQSHVEAWIRHFSGGLGEGLEAWIALDAMVFGDFIQHRIGDVFDRLQPDMRPDQRIESIESMTSHLLVQTSHQVSFCTEIDAIGAGRAEIHYQVDNIELVESPGEAVGSLDLAVFVADRHVMTITMGLMVKQLVSQ